MRQIRPERGRVGPGGCDLCVLTFTPSDYPAVYQLDLVCQVPASSCHTHLQLSSLSVSRVGLCVYYRSLQRLHSLDISKLWICGNKRSNDSWTGSRSQTQTFLRDGYS